MTKKNSILNLHESQQRDYTCIDLPFWMIRIVDVQGLMTGKKKFIVKMYTCYLASVRVKTYNFIS